MLLGYMRVSRADGSQVLDLQKDALLAAGVEAGHLYQDLASGKRDDRPGLAACLKALRRGDVLAAWKLDRLGRDLATSSTWSTSSRSAAWARESSPATAPRSTQRPPPASWSSGSSPRSPSSSAS